MIRLIKKMLGQTAQAETEEQDRTPDIRIATCALFLEMANIDGEFSDSERKCILAILQQEYELSEEDAKELAERAGEVLEGSVEIWKFTNLINTHYSEEEKIQIVELLWRIIYQDGKLDKYEDYLVKKVSTLLHLRHSQLIEAKLKVKETFLANGS